MDINQVSEVKRMSTFYVSDLDGTLLRSNEKTSEIML
jgi:hydroxymethylpyrimidine pyrophosphatase-like HAD family hydrolase